MNILIDNTKELLNSETIKKIMLVQILKKLKDENIITDYEFRMSTLKN